MPTFEGGEGGVNWGFLCAKSGGEEVSNFRAGTERETRMETNQNEDTDLKYDDVVKDEYLDKYKKIQSDLKPETLKVKLKQKSPPVDGTSLYFLR